MLPRVPPTKERGKRGRIGSRVARSCQLAVTLDHWLGTLRDSDSELEVLTREGATTGSRNLGPQRREYGANRLSSAAGGRQPRTTFSR